MEFEVSDRNIGFIRDEISLGLFDHTNAESLVQDKIAIHPILYTFSDFTFFEVLRQVLLEEKHLRILICQI